MCICAIWINIFENSGIEPNRLSWVGFYNAALILSCVLTRKPVQGLSVIHPMVCLCICVSSIKRRNWNLVSRAPVFDNMRKRGGDKKSKFKKSRHSSSHKAGPSCSLGVKRFFSVVHCEWMVTKQGSVTLIGSSINASQHGGLVMKSQKH